MITSKPARTLLVLDERTAVLAYSDPKVPVRQDRVTIELTRK